MSNQVVFDPVAAIRVARSYRAAALALEGIAQMTVERVKVPGTNLTGDFVQQILDEKSVPVVLMALAVEIALKVRLHLATVPFKRGHNHAELFDLLPEDQKKALEDRYTKRCNPFFISATLKDSLTWSGDAFVRWRYRYEWESVNASLGEMVVAFEVLQEGL